MDAEVERLGRAHRADPTDVGAALRASLAQERAGRFDPAWDALAPLARSERDPERAARDAVAALAGRAPRALLARLRRADYRTVRLDVELLVLSGQAAHPALVVLATDPGVDAVLKRHALRAIGSVLTGSATVLSRYDPDEVQALVATGARPRDTSAVPDLPRRDHWRGIVDRLLRGRPATDALALLPWIVPLLAVREPELNARAVALVRRLAERPAPPFDVETLARSLRETG